MNNFGASVGHFYDSMKDQAIGAACKLHTGTHDCAVPSLGELGRIAFPTPTCQPYKNQRKGHEVEVNDHESYYALLGGGGAKSSG